MKLNISKLQEGGTLPNVTVTANKLKFISPEEKARFDLIRKNQGDTTALNWLNVKQGTTAGINSFMEHPVTRIVEAALPIPSGFEGFSGVIADTAPLINTKYFRRYTKIPIKEGNYYRVASNNEIQNVLNTGKLQVPERSYYDQQTINIMARKLNMKPDEVAKLDVENPEMLDKLYNQAPSSKVNLRPRRKSNHGDIGFEKEGLYYDVNSPESSYNGAPIIVGNESKSIFQEGHHGAYTDKFNGSIPANSPVVLREGNDANNFTYFEKGPFLWREKSFDGNNGIFNKDIFTSKKSKVINGIKNNVKNINPKVSIQTPPSKVILVPNQSTSPFSIRWDTGLMKPVLDETPINDYHGELIVRPDVKKSAQHVLPSDYIAESKVRTPIQYKRDKTIDTSELLPPPYKNYADRTAELENKGYYTSWNRGRVYEAMHKGRGESLYSPYSLYKEETEHPFSKEIFENYKKAMSRHFEYNYPINEFIDRGDAIMYKPYHGDKSVVLGHLAGKNDDIFIASHFAPTSLRNGYEVIKRLSESKMPVIFSVPDFLSKQLEKANFTKLYSADRPFGDTVMRKDVMVNSSLTPDDISDLLEDYEY